MQKHATSFARGGRGIGLVVQPAAATATATAPPTSVPPIAPAPSHAPPVPPEPPDASICSITQELMVDPVMAYDGHTYEREAIERWLKRQQTSPKTGEPLASTILLPNHAMRGQIIEWLEQHNN